MKSEYFLLKCELKAKPSIITQNIHIQFNSISLYNQSEDKRITIKNRNIVYMFFINEDVINFNLYIENKGGENRIDYLIDEEYEIEQLNLSISQIDSEYNYDHKIVSECGQIEIDFHNQLLASVVNAELSNEMVCVMGHRPDRLYGYDLNNSKYQELANLIANKCEDLIINKGVKYFITGGSLGGDTVSFFAIEFLKKKYPNIKNIVAIPFKNVFIKWQPNDINRFNRMLSLADGVIEVDLLSEYNVPFISKGNYHISKMNNKNDFMIDCADYLLAIFDGKYRGSTYNTITYAKYNNKEISILDIGNKKTDDFNWIF